MIAWKYSYLQKEYHLEHTRIYSMIPCIKESLEKNGAVEGDGLLSVMKVLGVEVWGAISAMLWVGLFTSDGRINSVRVL